MSDTKAPTLACSKCGASESRLMGFDGAYEGIYDGVNEDVIWWYTTNPPTPIPGSAS